MIDEYVYNHCTQATGVPVFPIVVPQHQEYPCVTYRMITDLPDHLYKKPSTFRRTTYQVDAFGWLVTEVESLIEKLKTHWEKQSAYVDNIMYITEADQPCRARFSLTIEYFED